MAHKPDCLHRCGSGWKARPPGSSVLPHLRLFRTCVPAGIWDKATVSEAYRHAYCIQVLRDSSALGLMDKMKKKKVLLHQFIITLTLKASGFHRSEVAYCFLLGNSEGRCRGRRRKARWPCSHTLRLDEIPISRTLLWKAEWRLDKQQDGV